MQDHSGSQQSAPADCSSLPASQDHLTWNQSVQRQRCAKPSPCSPHPAQQPTQLLRSLQAPAEAGPCLQCCPGRCVCCILHLRRCPRLKAALLPCQCSLQLVTASSLHITGGYYKFAGSLATHRNSGLFRQFLQLFFHALLIFDHFLPTGSGEACRFLTRALSDADLLLAHHVLRCSCRHRLVLTGLTARSPPLGE